MGWSSGSYLANDVWNKIKEYIPKDEKQKVAKEILDLFENYDADDWCEPDGIEGVAHPEWFIED